MHSFEVGSRYRSLSILPVDFLQYVVNSTYSTLAQSPCLWNCRIDAVHGALVSPLAEALKNRNVDPPSPITKKFVSHELMHAKSIGFASRTGELVWLKWWELPPSMYLLGRLLSRGASWYFYNADRKPSRNASSSISFRGLSKVRSILDKRQIRYVKEDRGKRFVLVNIHLERSWFNTEAVTRKLIVSEFVEKSTARGYFLAKTLKDPPLKGRLIEGFGKVKPKHILPPEFFKSYPHNANSRASILNKILWNREPLPANYRIFSADIEKMFPNTSQPLLLAKLEEVFGDNLADRVRRELEAYRISYGGKTYSAPCGLPIGHPWSPELSQFLLCLLEKPFVSWLEKFDIRFVRYMDDTFFATPLDLVDETVSRYTEAVKPWTVTWEMPSKELRFTDLIFPAFTPSDRRIGLRSVALREKLQFPSGAIPKRVLSACAVGKLFVIASVRCSGRTKFVPQRETVDDMLDNCGLADFKKLKDFCLKESISFPKKLGTKRSRDWYVKGVTMNGTVKGMRGVKSLYTLLRVGFSTLRNRF